MRKEPILLLFLAVAISLFAAVPLSAFDGAASSVDAPRAPFSKGVNLSAWFEAASPSRIQFSKFTQKDFADLKGLGCDVIRLPINLKAMTSGAPEYALDPLFLSFLDQAVDWAEGLGMYIIIDNHTFNFAVPTEGNVEAILLKEWKQLAARYKDRSDFVVYEVLNEPHGIDCAKWAKIQGCVVAAIRAIDGRHAIIVGSANFNNYRDLVNLPAYPDKNLIYTFHFYDPMVFTHQGADFTTPSLVGLAGVPFPPDAGRMPPVPARLKGTWFGEGLADYATQAAPERIEEALDGPARFARERKVPVFCGEFGVYMPNAPREDRVAWHRLVRTALERRGISWAIWDAYGSFGLFDLPTGGRVEEDLNVPLVEALGLSAPTQRPRRNGPETGAVEVFRDYPGEGIALGGENQKGVTDYYSTDSPASGKYALRWGGGERYSSVSFTFSKPRDFTELVRKGYALEFMARVATPGASFQIRFRDAATAPEEKPWRMSRTVDGSLLPADGEWHRVRIPLSEMRETGAWQAAWFEPRGAFSWARIGTLEIAAETMPLKGIDFYFDDIAITQ
jgi:endoglucanase